MCSSNCFSKHHRNVDALMERALERKEKKIKTIKYQVCLRENVELFRNLPEFSDSLAYGHLVE